MKKMIFKSFISLQIVILLTACGGSSDSSTVVEPTNANEKNNEEFMDVVTDENISIDKGILEDTSLETNSTQDNDSNTNADIPATLVDNDAEFIQIDYHSYEGAKKTLFSDTASFFEISKYTINLNSLIEFKVENSHLEITNWVPRDLNNLLIVAKYEDVFYKMINLDILPGTSRLTTQFPWEMGKVKFKSLDDNKNLDFSKIDIEKVSFSFAPQDEVQERIASLRINWKLTFPDRVMLGDTQVCRPGKNVIWRPTHPQDARYLLSFMINAAQTFSHPKFYEFWMKTAFSDSRGYISNEDRLDRAEYNTYGDKEQQQYNVDDINNGMYFNKEHRQRTFDKYFEKHFALGITGGGGLGGGSTLGLNHNTIIESAWTYGQGAVDAYNRDDWYLADDDNSNFKTPWKIFGHESGHTLGFGHKESYCGKSKYSHISLGTIVYSHLLSEGKLIITQETMTGRDLEWEKPYNKWTKKKIGTERPRPNCGNAFEWGGSHEKHDINLPAKYTNPDDAKKDRILTLKWKMYLEENKKGSGLEYLKSIQ